MYDFLIVGAGLYGAVVAHEMTKRGKKVVVLDRRDHIGGNIYTEEIEGIVVHKYGAHIFHTSNVNVWRYMNSFVQFNHFVNSPIANYKGEIYNLPFNMNTFNKMWGVVTPDEAKMFIEQQKNEIVGTPSNLEEQAISLVGRDIYQKLIKGYTEKQWGRECTKLPPFIIKRIPVRFVYNNNYFDDYFQGIPIGGYTPIIKKMLQGVELRLSEDFLKNKEYWKKIAKYIIYTGPIDEYFDFSKGVLEYRSVRFENEILDTANFQGNAVVNYTDFDTPYTRIIEHKHFEFGNQPKTVISKEYSTEWKVGKEPYYPINDEKNYQVYIQYKRLSEREKNIYFGGRLGEYQYYNMDKVVEKALKMSDFLKENVYL